MPANAHTARVDLVAIVAIACASSACATATSSSSDAAENAFDDGLRLERVGLRGPASQRFADAADAASAFRAAALLHAADDARANGDARLELRSLRALVAIEPPSVLRVEAERRLSRTTAPVAASIHVTTSEPADISIDGEIVGRTPLDALAIAPGAHAIAASTPGAAPTTASVVVDAGRAVEVSLVLDPLPRAHIDKRWPLPLGCVFFYPGDLLIAIERAFASQAP